jgi:hypothetical protein
MDRRTKATLNRDKGPRLMSAWNKPVAQARYSDDGHWYALLTRFPAALVDANGYLIFESEAQFRPSPRMLCTSMYADTQCTIPHHTRRPNHSFNRTRHGMPARPGRYALGGQVTSNVRPPQRARLPMPAIASRTSSSTYNAMLPPAPRERKCATSYLSCLPPPSQPARAQTIASHRGTSYKQLHRLGRTTCQLQSFPATNQPARASSSALQLPARMAHCQQISPWSRSLCTMARRSVGSSPHRHPKPG